MSFHRYIASFKITLVQSNNTNDEEPLPMPDDVVRQVTAAINDGLKKTKPTKGGKSYDVETVSVEKVRKK